MRWTHGMRARLRLLFRTAAESRMAEEFAFHIERATEENIRAGMQPSEARRQALIAFGAVESHRESMRDTWRFAWLGDVVTDVRFALRWLRRSPGFAAVGMLTIALGIGATTALFSVIHALLLQPLPVLDPERLYSVQEERSGYVSDGIEGMQVPHGRYEAYTEATSTLFTGLAAHAMTDFAMRDDGGARPVSGVLVSGNYFEVLGVRPEHGRLFGASDEPVVVLSHRTWEARFGGDPGAVGRPVYLDGRPLTVVGIAARRFTGTNVGLSADVWVPYRAATEAGESAWSDVWMTPVGRLRPGLDARQVQAVLSTIAQRIEVDAPGAEVQGARLEPMTGLLAELRPVVAGFLGLLLGMAILVLLIAGANIAGMLLGRAVTRRREVAVRLAIGAGRGRLVRQLLTESIVLFLLGGVGGVLIASWTTRLIGRISTQLVQSPVLVEAEINLPVLGFGLAAAALTGLAFGLLPALRTSRPELGSALRDGSLTGGTRSGRGRSVFVVGQIALAVILVAVAGLFARTLQTALRIDPGFDPNDVVVASFDLSMHDYDEVSGPALQAALLERIRGMGDVESAALARVALLTGNSQGYDLAPVDDAENAIIVRVNAVDSQYLQTMRIDLVAGRGFDERGGGRQPHGVIVNESLASLFWPGENALGKLVRRGDTDFAVVGIARNGLYRDYRDGPAPFAFLPLEHTYSPRTVLHVRTQVPPAAMVERIRDEVMLLDPNVALEQGGALANLTGALLLPQRIGAYLMGAFGVIGLLLAGLGVYGVLSHRVAERTRELGIRIALGASPGSVLRLVLRNIAFDTAVGVAIGVLVAMTLGRLIRSFLFGISAHDPLTFLIVPLLLAGVALLASVLPVRRAVRADPVTALRQE